MVRVKYTKDADNQENVTVHINSFVVVASVSYLLEIANFFIPEELSEFSSIFETNQPQTKIIHEEESNLVVRTILVKMDEPDIVLVNNIEDINTDAIMLNAELTINVTQQPERLAFVLTVDSLRGHTCKFNPEHRESSLAQVLHPTNMGMHFSQDSDTNRQGGERIFSKTTLDQEPLSIINYTRT